MLFLRNLLGAAVFAFLLPLQSSGHTIPAFVWTSSEGLITQSGNNAIYESIYGSELVGAVLQDGQQSQSSRITSLDSNKVQATKGLVTVLISGKATRTSLGDNTRESQALRSSLEAASSSIYLANVYEAPLATGSNALQIGKCSPESAGETVASLRSKLIGESLTVRVCEGEEAGHLTAVEKAISESEQPYIMAYFGHQDESLDRPAGRTLLQSPGKQVLCDDKCQTQVRLFETIILLVILLTALWIGMNMLHILDTPSKFETEKKEQNRHQD